MNRCTLIKPRGPRRRYILAVMRQCLETAEFEKRIADIERAVGRPDAAAITAFKPRIV